MPEIDIRALERQLSEVFRAVREKRAAYIVTLRGQPVAMIMPFGQPAGSRKLSHEQFWAEMDALAQEMDEETGGKSALQQLFEDRGAS